MKKSLSIIVMLSLSILVAKAEVNLKICTSCHGKDFSRHALDKSKIVNDMNATEISAALIGYKNGTYKGAGSMRGLMKLQTSKYSDEELKKVAIEIKKMQ